MVSLIFTYSLPWLLGGVCYVLTNINQGGTRPNELPREAAAQPVRALYRTVPDSCRQERAHRQRRGANQNGRGRTVRGWLVG